MEALVVVEASTGSLRRYECGGERPVLTHEATADGPVTFPPGLVEEFRMHPDARFSVRAVDATAGSDGGAAA